LHRGLISGCRCFWWWLIGIVAFAGVDLVTFLGGGNLDLAELAVPIFVFGIVAEAVLVVQFVGDFVERGFELIDTAHFEHAAAGGLGQFLEQGLAVAVLLVDVELWESPERATTTTALRPTSPSR
jgi:hypothetical protein